MAFRGFSVKTLEFLVNLRFNNNKAWFESHRNDYKEFLLKPFQELVIDIAGFMQRIDNELETSPMVDKTISRIYRDVRFSKDKSPYRSNMWISFKRRVKDWKDSPVFYFELNPEDYRYGLGYYQAEKETMDKLRNFIDRHPDEFLKIVSGFMNKNIFKLEGDKYKKVLDQTKSIDILDWYQRKNFYLVNNKKIDDTLFSSNLVEELKTNFQILKPFYDFLWKINKAVF